MTSDLLRPAETGQTPFTMPADATGTQRLSAFLGSCHANGLDVVLRHDAPDEWQRLLDHTAYVPVGYTPAMLDYQSAYFLGSDAASIEASIMIMNDRKPCAVWPLLLRSGVASSALSSSGTPLLPPLFRQDTPSKTVKSIVTRCHALAEDHCRQLGSASYAGQEPFDSGEGLGEWYLQAMRSGAAASVGHEMFIDLSLPLQEIRAAIRKSYKPLISMGERLWTASICSSAAPDLWDEFRQLHLEVAGRSTRSLESWEKQHRAIAAGDAFFVHLREPAGRMVGGALFHLSRDEGLYAVGAYDRTLFDKPLGHLVQYHAINEMKRRGLKWYRIGQCAFPGDHPPPTAKEVAISHFKQGFATHTFAVHRFERPVGETIR